LKQIFGDSIVQLIPAIDSGFLIQMLFAILPSLALNTIIGYIFIFPRIQLLRDFGDILSVAKAFAISPK
jgi:hypothetical protein